MALAFYDKKDTEKPGIQVSGIQICTVIVSLLNFQLYMTNSSGDINATNDRERSQTFSQTAKPLSCNSENQMKNLKDYFPGNGKGFANFTFKQNETATSQPISATKVVHNRDGPVKSVISSSFVPSSPSKIRDPAQPYFPTVRKTPPLYTAVPSKAVPTADSQSNVHTRDSSVPSISSNTLVTSPAKNRDNYNPGNKKNSPLYTSVGSRKNLLDLAGITAESAILNTPMKIGSENLGKLAIAAPAMQSPYETRKSGYYQPNQSTFNTSRPKPEISRQNSVETQTSKFEPPPTKFVEFQPRSSGLARPKPVSYLDHMSTRPKPFLDNSTELNSSIRPNALSHFPALSPSAKYTSDNTPTPPLRTNQFVRRVTGTGSNLSKLPRRKFSMIRDQFESPEVKRRVSTDLYENISNNLLKNDEGTTRDKCKSGNFFMIFIKFREMAKVIANLFFQLSS